MAMKFLKSVNKLNDAYIRSEYYTLYKKITKTAQNYFVLNALKKKLSNEYEKSQNQTRCIYFFFYF